MPSDILFVTGLLNAPFSKIQSSFDGLVKRADLVGSPTSPFKYPGRGDGVQSAWWVGTHQHPAIPNFYLKIKGRPIDFEMGHFETDF